MIRRNQVHALHHRYTAQHPSKPFSRFIDELESEWAALLKCFFMPFKSNSSVFGNSSHPTSFECVYSDLSGKDPIASLIGVINLALIDDCIRITIIETQN